MSLDLAAAARSLLASEGTGSATTADRIAQASERLTVHLSRLVGLFGIQALFRRSLVISTRTFPWLVEATRTVGSEERLEDLRTQMAKQNPEVATDAFVLIFSTFVGLLGRLIGEELVWRLLHEVWPTVFPTKKETS